MAILARRRNRTLSDQEAIDWATLLLTEGLDSPALRELAGADVGRHPNSFLIDGLVDRAARELGASGKNPLAAYFTELAAAIVEASPEDVRPLLREIWDQVILPLDIPPVLHDWYTADDGFDLRLATDVDPIAQAKAFAAQWQHLDLSLHRNPGDA